MTDKIKNIRKENLKKLISNYGGQTALGSAIQTSPSYLNHVINGRRNLGDNMCRKIEVLLKLNTNWMNLEH